MKLSVSSEASATGGLDSRLIATVRLVLSSSVLFSIGPSEIELSLDIFQIPSALYAVYSAVLYVFARRPTQPAVSKISYSADAGWVALLILFSDNISLAFLFLFSTAIAAFQRSFAAALRLTLVAATFAAVMGLLKVQLGSDLQHHEILLPPIYLVVFGYLLAYWCAREIATKRRLVLLKEITRLSNPRFGIDRTVGTMIERLRAFHDAETCLMIVADPVSDTHVLRRGSRSDPERANEAELIPAETAQLLLGPPPEQALIYDGAPVAGAWRRHQKPSCYVVDVQEGWPIAATDTMSEALITIIDAQSFISVPLQYRDNAIGRLYLTSARRRAFTPADINFLLQVVNHMIPVIENIRLVDRLASSAAEEERRRLARDIHDNVVQTFIGFQIGLAGVNQKLHAGIGDLPNELAQLMAITNQMIDTLRQYIHSLPGDSKRESFLLEAVWNFVATFSKATHIDVHVETASDLHINDRLAAEIFQMVVEGLSNIRRHTQATRANIGLTRQNDCLILQIANDGAGAVSTRFIPRSIAGRAAAIGGRTRVEHITGGTTHVIVEIPL